MCRRGFFSDERVRFFLILPAFAVAENDVAHGKFFEHSGTNFASESADVSISEKMSGSERCE